MSHTIWKFLLCVFGIALLFQVPALYSKDLGYTLVSIENLNRYDEDRVLYQQFESTLEKYASGANDNSIAALMVIKDKKVYLFEDGYDSPEQVKLNRDTLDRSSQILPDMWQNKIDSIPDFVLITDRRIELQRNTAKEWVSSNY